MISTTRNPLMAAALSILLPGLGQLYLGERAKGIAMVCMALGVMISCITSRSLATWLLMGLVYVAILVPAAVDAYQVSRGRSSPINSDKRWYVIGALLVIGPFALPLLWQSQRFSRTAKIIWTVAVILIALLMIATMAALGPFLDQILDAFRLGKGP